MFLRSPSWLRSINFYLLILFLLSNINLLTLKRLNYKMFGSILIILRMFTTHIFISIVQQQRKFLLIVIVHLVVIWVNLRILVSRIQDSSLKPYLLFMAVVIPGFISFCFEWYQNQALILLPSFQFFFVFLVFPIHLYFAQIFLLNLKHVSLLNVVLLELKLCDFLAI